MSDNVTVQMIVRKRRERKPDELSDRWDSLAEFELECDPMQGLAIFQDALTAVSKPRVVYTDVARAVGPAYPKGDA